MEIVVNEDFQEDPKLLEIEFQQEVTASGTVIAGKMMKAVIIDRGAMVRKLKMATVETSISVMGGEMMRAVKEH
jgi:hypothetical protein